MHGQTSRSMLLQLLPGAESENRRWSTIGSGAWLLNSIVLRNSYLAGLFTDRAPAAALRQPMNFLMPLFTGFGDPDPAPNCTGCAECFSRLWVLRRLRLRLRFAKPSESPRSRSRFRFRIARSYLRRISEAKSECVSKTWIPIVCLVSASVRADAGDLARTGAPRNRFSRKDRQHRVNRCA